MAYVKNPTWNSGAGPGVDAGALSNIETEYDEAILSFNPDVFTAGFVLSGLTAAKDGVTFTQLDLASGTAYLVQSSDSTLRQRKIGSQSFTTVTMVKSEVICKLGSLGDRRHQAGCVIEVSCGTGGNKAIWARRVSRQSQ